MFALFGVLYYGPCPLFGYRLSVSRRHSVGVLGYQSFDQSLGSSLHFRKDVCLTFDSRCLFNEEGGCLTSDAQVEFPNPNVNDAGSCAAANDGDLPSSREGDSWRFISRF